MQIVTKKAKPAKNAEQMERILLEKNSKIVE